ncbi:lipopolysaccharide assembly protein LapB [Microbulbifer yueqingensis]|uniref:Lipopolysaccharide assembly protein B n=1 Tax=Microbulbifer yueqingensis TaxID=658219 RepID=A0A1G8UGS1_9GAMM|nr:lipopolysaccharide assembly protein LapB [Microbulbifer yueqingensis]SDJ52972.1 Lipopolysaccharide biosynthesis regulator YciM, contains six TPR domains and a predicted metal-binding C-terminal domain [Microbulbifer yueqingensis]
MADLTFFFFLLAAIAIGWLLGRRSLKKKADCSEQQQALARTYVQGLNYLLSEQRGDAIDKFIDSLEVSSTTFDTHLALGNLLRKRGEHDQAIRVHQNLLARPSLARASQHKAQLELARDYIAAGWLDRAERLLQELVEASPELRNTSLEHLVEVYRDEREWPKAIHAVNLLHGRRFKRMPSEWASIQAHFCCELAEESINAKDYLSARKHIDAALGYDRSSARANLLWARLEYLLGRPEEAIKVLQRIPRQNPDYVPEILDLLTTCYEAVGDEAGLDRYLEQLLREHPFNSVLIALTERIERKKSEAEAAEFMGRQLAERPSLRGLGHFLDLHIDSAEGRARENLSLLKSLIDQLIASRPNYRCNNCGFSGNQLHWLCPSCKHWDSVRSVKGVEGE